MMTEMNAVKNRTGNGVLRRGVALFAVLLLVSVLMAGAVSADKTATVSSFQELKDNLTNNEVTTIILANGFETSETINVNRAVTIDGNWNTITASSTFSSTYGHLMGISGNMAVILKNITLNSNSKAKGVQAYLQTGTATEIPFQNVVLLNSAGSGLTVNGAKITATNLTVKGSAWQSVDVGLGSGVTPVSVFTLDAASNLEDTYQISSDLTKNTVFGTVSPLPEGYKEYQLFAEDNSVYKIVRKYWSNKADFPATLANADGLNFNVSVTNKTGHVSVHTSLYQALTNYVDMGATVTVLKDFEHEYDYTTSPSKAAINRPTITKAVTLDLNGKNITAKATDAAKTADTAFIKINGNDAALTVKTGKITLDGPYMFYAAGKGSLTIESGTFEATGTIASTNGLNEDANIIISGGTLKTTGNAPVIFMPGTKTLKITGDAVLEGPVGIDIKSGAVEISGNAKITATGTNAYATTKEENGPVSKQGDLGSAIVLERNSAYKGDLSLTIKDDAQISSTSGAAIRNYIREGDMTYKPKGGSEQTFAAPTIAISDSAKLSGNIAAIENAQYTGDTATHMGAFSLTGGYYSAPSYVKLLVGNPTVTYAANHAMSDTPVKDGYYAPVAVKTPEKPAETNDDGTEVTGVSGSTPAVSGNVATITQNTGAASGIKVNLTLTYPSGTSPSVSGQTITASAAPTTVIAEYSPVNLDNTIGGSFNLIVEFSNVTNITKLPNISTTINLEAQTKLEGQGLSLMSMVVVDITQMKAAGEKPILTLTFTVPISKFTGKDLGSLRAYHYDGTNLKEGPTPTRTPQGDNYVFTITGIREASPWMLGARTSTPTPPTPQPVYSSGDGNMDGAYRVLFETNGGSFISPATGLSSGDKITLPAAPTKEGSSFVGWYKDAACTQAWSFSETIDGDMTLYAKWSGGSSGSAASATTVATAQPTTKQTSAPAATTSQSQASATTAAPAATTAAGVSPTLTQAPAPVFGALLGLLAAGVLLRRRD